MLQIAHKLCNIVTNWRLVEIIHIVKLRDCSIDQMTPRPSPKSADGETLVTLLAGVTKQRHSDTAKVRWADYKQRG